MMFSHVERSVSSPQSPSFLSMPMNFDSHSTDQSRQHPLADNILTALMESKFFHRAKREVKGKSVDFFLSKRKGGGGGTGSRGAGEKNKRPSTASSVSSSSKRGNIISSSNNYSSNDNMNSALLSSLNTLGFRREMRELIYKLGEELCGVKSRNRIGSTSTTTGKTTEAISGANTVTVTVTTAKPPQGTGRYYKDPIPSVEMAKINWWDSINGELEAVGKERGELIFRRFVDKSEGIDDSDGGGTSGGSSGGGSTIDAGANSSSSTNRTKPQQQQKQKTIRFIFDSSDLLACLTSIPSSSTNNASSSAPRQPYKSMIALHLPTPSLQSLRKTFKELHPTYRHIGLDDSLLDSERFIRHRHDLGEKVAREGYGIVTRQYLKFGVGGGSRGKLWGVWRGGSGNFGVEDRSGAGEGGTNTSTSSNSNSNSKRNCNNNSRKEELYYANLTRLSKNLSYPVCDELFRMDCLNMSNDFQFFPFVEVLEGVVTCFSRDKWVLNNSSVGTHKQIIARDERLSGSSKSGRGTVGVPESGVHPFKRMVNYVAPLAFVYEKEEPIYFVFRSLWAR